MSTCGIALERERHAVEQVARLDQRHVERLAVEGDYRAVRRRPTPRPPPAARARARSRAAGTAARDTPSRSMVAQPTRNACVPAPPARPVVSRSRNHRDCRSRESDRGSESRRPVARRRSSRQPETESGRPAAGLAQAGCQHRPGLVRVEQCGDDVADPHAPVQFRGGVVAIDDDDRRPWRWSIPSRRARPPPTTSWLAASAAGAGRHGSEGTAIEPSGCSSGARRGTAPPTMPRSRSVREDTARTVRRLRRDGRAPASRSAAWLTRHRRA